MSTHEEPRPQGHNAPGVQPRWQRWLQWLVAALIAALGLVLLYQPVPQIPGGKPVGTSQ